MGVSRIFIGTIYDLGRLVSGLSLLAGLVYLARGFYLDNQTDGVMAVTYFVLGAVFWAIARVFRRYAI